MIALGNDRVRLTVDPDRGASVLRFEALMGAGAVPVLAPADPPGDGPAEAAMFLMAPFANRARGNRLRHGNHVIPVQPNTDEPLALHGIAWQRTWTVAAQSSDRLRLRLDPADRDPMRLRMTFDIALTATGAAFGLTLETTGDGVLPVGLGFHPFFPRLPETTVAFAAQHLWPEGEGHLPRGREPVPGGEDYRAPRRLPEAWRNQCYSGWSGRADIDQPSLGYTLRVEARGLGALMLFATPDMPRFALEPQSHVSGETATGPDGLRSLAPGASVSGAMALDVSQAAGPG